jgi:cytochrome P450
MAPGPGLSSMLRGALVGDSSGTQVDRYRKAWERYGDVVRFHLGPMTVHLFVHPDHIAELVTQHKDTLYKGSAYDRPRQMIGLGLVTSEGALWQRQRRLLQPRFSATAVAQFARTMTDCTEDLLDRWSHAAGQGTAIHVDEEMMHLTMRIIGRTMLSVDLTAEGDLTELGQAIESALAYMSARSGGLFTMPPWVPTPTNRRFALAMSRLDAFIYGLIEQRRAELHTGPDDLVSLLLQARDQETGEGIGDSLIRDELLTVFFAGHETTALLLTWAWYVLSNRPDVEGRLHEELDRVLGGRLPTVEDLPQLPYTRALVSETLRLYPSAWIIARNVAEDDVVAGYRIPKGSMVVLSPYLSQRHPAYWADAETFDPNRFLAPGAEQELKRRAPYAYFPFGIGHRTCIGNHFALLEAQLVLATVAQRYCLRLVPGLEIEPQPVATLRPNRAVAMTLQRR